MVSYFVIAGSPPYISFKTKEEAESYFDWATGGDDVKITQSSIVEVDDGEVPVDPRLTAAFKQLRAKGYTALENHWCCASCGWAVIPDEEADKAVFYHAQDFARFLMTRTGYLVWDGDGEEICATLVEAGLQVQWDGSKATRIKVIL
ncbi:MAG: hypothetical protein WCJ64_01470 [Rhodospirillaceae bacterium]